MRIKITDQPSAEHDKTVIEGTRAYNASHITKDHQPLSVYMSDQDGNIVAGLTGRTYGGWMHIEYLWVSKPYRGKGLGTKIIMAAEKEARKRICKNSSVDTFNFQALDFYLKKGYEEFGTLHNYFGNATRHYLQKRL
jgi:GNAT superfamily N-acetyltransferase